MINTLFPLLLLYIGGRESLETAVKLKYILISILARIKIMWTLIK